MSDSDIRLREPVIVIYTSGSPSFKSTRRFVYTICGIHQYTSPKEKKACEDHVLFPSLANNAFCEQETISKTSCVLKISKDTSSCPVPPVFVVDASALQKSNDGFLCYKYR